MGGVRHLAFTDGYQSGRASTETMPLAMVTARVAMETVALCIT